MTLETAVYNILYNRQYSFCPNSFTCIYLFQPVIGLVQGFEALLILDHCWDLSHISCGYPESEWFCSQAGNRGQVPWEHQAATHLWLCAWCLQAVPLPMLSVSQHGKLGGLQPEQLHSGAGPIRNDSWLCRTSSSVYSSSLWMESILSWTYSKCWTWDWMIAELVSLCGPSRWSNIFLNN